MIDDWGFEPFPLWQETSSSLRAWEKIKALRILLESSRTKLDNLEGDPTSDEDAKLEQKAIIDATQREIQRLERKSFYAEFGME